MANPRRGYGGGAHELLQSIATGVPWRRASESLFAGRGSFGNGGAMRVGPLGAFFHDDLDECAVQAQLSAEVTHYHPEGQAGAVAVAIAAAMAVSTRKLASDEARQRIMEAVLDRTPESRTREALNVAAQIATDAPVRSVVGLLGNGSRVSAQDTVPFAVWAALSSLDSYSKALWKTVSGLGDRDTTCAIAGGIVVSRVGRDGIPPEWMSARERLSLSI